MESRNIRRAFLNYFKTMGHTIVPSSPVVPFDDPTLLFINAGMNQFKDLFLGKAKRDYTRAATTQKCIRVGGKHNDLENVGHTSRHLTFFEMLGNFSFGDYFKKEAIAFAWDVTTHVFGFDPDKVWVSVYNDDDEAFALWEKHISSKRIVRFGEKENFWAMGDTGPCGPCSELLFDRGDKYGNFASPKDDPSGERYLEFWNLVFMQFEKSDMSPLPKQSIDTGAGLERVVSLKMGKDNVFETDILRSLIAGVETISGKKYDPRNEKLAPCFHVIADHIRSLSFAIGDGVQPSNTDRGYVLRKILRRAVRYGRMIGLQRPFLGDLVPRLIENMGDDFPELKESEGRIIELLTIEEEAFIKTLLRGGNLLQSVVETAVAGTKKISGEEAFKLKDTYGFPLEEIELIAKDSGLVIDQARFSELEEEAKEKSRKARTGVSQEFEKNFFTDFRAVHAPCQFVGYDKQEAEGKVIGLIVDGKFTDVIKDGMEGMIILDTTPFYAEMGGQVGDTGELDHKGSIFQVIDTKSPYSGVVTHVGKMGRGEIKKGDKLLAKVNEEKRTEVENNHTATHLLHLALQKVLGSHIRQAGSLVDNTRLRFDFNHHKAITPTELRQIEDLVNYEIRKDNEVKTYEISFEEAQKRSDIKQFFGEKYGDKVRVVDADTSKELCGGTHATRTGRIGYFKITKESSIAAGVRRIEAVSGQQAEKWVQKEEDLLSKLGEILKATSSNLLEKVNGLVQEKEALESKLKAYRKNELKKLAVEYVKEKEKVGTTFLIAKEITIPFEDLPSFAEELVKELKSGVVALGVKEEAKCQLIVAVSDDLVAKKVAADQLIKSVSSCISGGGGGRAQMAQAGGKNPAGLKEALHKIRDLLQNV